MDTEAQKIVERLQKANNVLITVTSNPTIDQLSAALGLSLVLNKLDKHATAVYSGETPDVMSFLQPTATFEKTTDSLRDFIISLDKDKADKLRYKVEDSVVRIFITPYRTSITDKDLEFSQGDFNVDVVVALGVHQQGEIDQAITAHGRILHDATVITMTNDQASELGAINLFSADASSLSEITAQVSLQLGEVFDKQIATAFLTGIVSETHQFSNERTTAQAMDISSKLLAAGADQQLVATQLTPKPEPAVEPTPEPAPAPEPVADPAPEPTPLQPVVETTIKQPEAAKDETEQPEVKDDGPAEIHIDANGTLQITHERKKQPPVASPAAPSKVEAPTTPVPAESQSPAPTSQIVAEPPAQAPEPSREVVQAAATQPAVSAPAPAPSQPEPVITAPAAPSSLPLPDPDLVDMPELPPPVTTHPSISHGFSGNKKPAVTNNLDIDGASVSAARDAVMGAIGAANTAPQEPVVSLNAQPLGDPVHDALSQPEQTMTLPVPNGAVSQFTPAPESPQAPASTAPPVPPPVMPFTPPPPQQ